MKEKVWVEIDQKKLLLNVKQIKSKLSQGTKLCCVVKSNAYGHGLTEVVKITQKYADFFAVDSVYEARQISSFAIKKPILILGYTLNENLKIVIVNRFHQVICNYESLQEMSKICEKLKCRGKVHLKIETGTSRQGIHIKDLNKFIVHIRNSKFLELCGISTHYANIEDTTDHHYAFEQLKKFKIAIKRVNDLGCSNFLKHTACSAAIILYPQTHFDLARLGISMYGLWSSAQTKAVLMKQKSNINLVPCLTWKTIVAHIKILPKGSFVSYGCTEKIVTPTRVAVIPVGYWDGYDRKLSSIGNVLIKGTRCKILGRICMNMMIVNVDHLKNLNLQEEVVLLGKQNNEEITAEELAQKASTINYEIVTRINPLIKRIIK